MGKSLTNLVDEGFRVSLVETAFFDGKFEIPHVVAPSKIIIPKGMVPFSARERSQDKRTLSAFMNMTSTFERYLQILKSM
jgi:hypothetical protein